MQRIYSEQTTQIQYNRHLAAYYRQQIAALQKGLPRCPPSSTAVAAVEDDSIDNIDSIDPIIIVDDPIAALDFPTQQILSTSRPSRKRSIRLLLRQWVPAPLRTTMGIL